MALISCNTLEELRAHTRLLINEPVGKSALDDTDDVDRCINLAIRDIARIIRSYDERAYATKGDIVLVSGTEFYDLPDDFIKIILIQYKKTGSQEPDKVPAVDILHKFDVDEISYFLISEGAQMQIGITPIPTTAYTLQLFYYYIPPLLEAVEDVPDVPEDFREAIAYGAAVKLGESLNNPIPQIRDTYVAKVDDIRRHFAPLQLQNNRSVGG